MKIGGQIPWNAILICETFKISCLMGELQTKDILDNHLKDQSFHLVHWLSITLPLRKTVKNPSIWKESLYALCAGGIWKGDIMVADINELETMDASEIYSKRLNAKEVIFPKENGKIHFPVADGRIKFVGGDEDLRTSTLIRERPV